MKILKRLKILFIVFLMFNFSCAKQTIFKNKCNVTQKKPKWANSTNMIEIPGYYVGVGYAENKKFEEAKSKAIRNLSEKISADIKSEGEISEEQKLNSSFKKEAKFKINISSNIKLYDLKQDSQWIDENCNVWVRFKIEKNIAHNILKFQEAEDLYKIAKESKNGLETRISSIKKALNIIETIDFSTLRTNNKKKFYITIYRNLKEDLEKIIQGREVVYFVKSPNESFNNLSEALIAKLINDNKGGLYEKKNNCEKIETCFLIARENLAKKMVIVKIDSKIKDDGMLCMGILNIDIYPYDVKSEKILKKPFNINRKLFSYNKNSFNWENTIKEELTKEDVLYTY